MMTIAGPELTDFELSKIARLVYEQSGIRLHAGKRALITARLQKRVRLGGFSSFRQYVRYVQNDRSGSEMTALLDAITTNHTSFFREPQHFDFLRRVVIPPIVARRAAIAGWSAACATGEEPYSIAMTLTDAGEAAAHARVVASDLSTRALATARAGVYKAERIAGLPAELQRTYFEPGTGDRRGLVRATPALRRIVEFHHANLLEASNPDGSFDFIFCRNVMFYFDRAARQRVVTMLERHLVAGGFLFVSHAESLSEVRHALRRCAPGVYQRGDA